MMVIAIQSRGVLLTGALRGHVRKRLSFSLGRCGSRIQRVDVKLSDINGPRGGIDKRCLIKVQVLGKRHIVVEDIQSDLYTAIDRAAGRAGRTLARRLSMQFLDRQRSHNPRPIPVR